MLLTAPRGAGWPSAGRIEYRGVSAIYRPGLPPVLRDLSFTLEVRMLLSLGVYDCANAGSPPTAGATWRCCAACRQRVLPAPLCASRRAA